jgi:type IV pilus assembly protein PilN
MRIALNLATRPFADLGPALKRLRIAMGVLAMLVLGLWFGIHAFHQKAEAARARERAVDAQINAIRQERQGYMLMMQQPENDQLLKHVTVLNQLFDEKAFSWTLAMTDLENVLSGGVQAINLEPQRAKDGHITLHLRVVGPRDKAVELVRNLEHSRHFLLPRITGESAESTGGPGQKLEPISASNRVNFDVLADYNSAAAEIKPAAKNEKAEGEEPSAGKRGKSNPGVKMAAPAPHPAAHPPAAAPPAHPSPSAVAPAMHAPGAATPAAVQPRAPFPSDLANRPPYTGQSHPAPAPPSKQPALPQGGPR